jgi:Flp pilus assembly protein TadB
MPAATTIAVLAATAVAAGGTAYQMSESSKARKEARDATSRQERRQLQLEAEARTRAEQEEAQMGQSKAKARQKALAAGATGRRDTILTGPLGVPGADTSGGGKTLLGV